MKTKRPNKETLDAINEAEAVQNGLSTTKSYISVKELLKDCLIDDENTAD